MKRRCLSAVEGHNDKGAGSSHAGFSKTVCGGDWHITSRVRAVLMQDKHPIAFLCKTLGIPASNKSIYEKELMAIMFAILKWKHYLLRRRFMVKTNQKSLKHLLEQQEVNSDYQKLVMKLMGFDFVIEYNPGKNNLVAGALSRIPYYVMELGVLLSSTGIDWGLLQEEVKKDATLTRVRHAVEKGEHVPLGFELVNDLLYIKCK